MGPIRGFRFPSRAADLWERTRNSFWLVPSVMLAAAVGLAFGMVRLDYALYGDRLIPKLWFNTMQGDAARAILATLASSMATIAGVVFSITIVALQLASSQFGPHVLRSFLADTGTQVSLGTFVASFIYAILVILTVRDQSGFVPYAATYMAILIAAVAMVVLVYFINHVANFIRIESVTGALAADLRRVAPAVFPEEVGHGEEVEREEAPRPPPGFDRDSRGIAVTEGGYIRRIDETALMRLAATYDLLIWLACRPGDFVVTGTTVMAVAPSGRIDARLAARLRDTVVLGSRRTPEQDVAYAFQQIAEVAVRALSPGINAPFTAIPCIDLIGEGLCGIAGRRMPSLRRCDDAGQLRVLVARGLTLADLARNALGPIASAGREHAHVMARLIETALLVAARARVQADRDEIRALAAAFTREAEAGLGSERERAVLRATATRS